MPPDKELKLELLAARNSSDIFVALSCAEWRRANANTDCPSDRIASPDDPLAVVVVHAGHDDMGSDRIADPLRGELADKIHESLSAIMWDAPNDCRLAFIFRPDTAHRAAAFRKSDGKIVASWPLEQVHERWRTLPDGKRPRHPLGLLVHVVQGRPRSVAYDAGGDRGRILPSKLPTMVVNDNHRRAGHLIQSTEHGTGVLNTDGRQSILFGFERPRNSPPLPLALYHLGIGNRARGQQGRGAPLALRLFIEAVLAFPHGERDGSGAVLLETTLRLLMKQMWPAQPVRASNMPSLWAACEALDSHEARIPILNPGGYSNSLLRIVDFLAIPDRFDPDAPVAIRVHLPPGVGAGPIMPDALNAWGAWSSATYNALIGLAFMWHVPGKLRIPAPNGKRKGKSTHWLQVQDPARYPDLTDDDLIDLCFPIGASRPHRALLADARKVVADLSEAGGVRVESGTRSINRKLLPPPPGQVLSAPQRRPSA